MLGRDEGGGGAHLLEPDGAVRVVGPGLAQLDEVGGVVLGRHGGTAVPLGGAVEHPGVHGRDTAEAGGLGRGEGLVVLVPGGVVLGVQMQPARRALLAGGQQPRQPGVDLVGRGPVGVGVGAGRELVDLVAEGHADEVGPVGQRRGERPQVGRLALDDVRVGEQIAPVPGPGPRRQEVEAAQVPLQTVDVDVQAAFGGGVGQPHQLVHGGGTDQGAVGLEVRPQREDPDVVEAQRGDRVEVGPDGVEVEVEPVVEPPFAGGVVDAEAHGRRHAVSLRLRKWPRGWFSP